MAERTGIVTFKGNPITLVGDVPKVGAPAPDFTAQKTLMEAFSLATFAGKTLVRSVAPSVDTGVCAVKAARRGPRPIFGAGTRSSGEQLARCGVMVNVAAIHLQTGTRR